MTLSFSVPYWDRGSHVCQAHRCRPKEDSLSKLEARIRGAWQGRISGCQLGKPVELLSMFEGHESLSEYLGAVNTLPLRDYVGFKDRPHIQKQSCREFLTRSEPDDDIDYSVLALLMLERFGLALGTEDVARSWLRM